MFLKRLLINQFRTTILMISIFLCSCAEKKKKKVQTPCAFKVFQQFSRCFRQISKESLAKRTTKANIMTSKVMMKKTIWLLNQWHAMMATFFVYFQRWKLALDTFINKHVNICCISCVLKMLSFRDCLVYQNSFLQIPKSQPGYVSYTFLIFFAFKPYVS